MKIRKATLDDQAVLLMLMRESFELETEVSADEWAKTEAAVMLLLNDPQAGESYLTYDEDDDFTKTDVMVTPSLPNYFIALKITDAVVRRRVLGAMDTIVRSGLIPSWCVALPSSH